MFASDTMADHLELERAVWSLGRPAAAASG
jgi:hypothetical protein